MGYTISENIEKFSNTDKNFSCGNSNVYAKNNTLYSYGYHFPLMVKMKHKSWKKFNKNPKKMPMLLNADNYSSSTSQHQNECFSYCTIQLPFSALQNIITGYNYWKEKRQIEYSKMTSQNEIFQKLALIDKTDERWDLINYQKFDYENNKYNYISIQEYENLNNENKYKWYENKERRPESVVLRFERKYFLSSMDENQYFIVELAKPCKTVKEAFEMIKPEFFRNKVENQDYLRQGEWFLYDITPYLNFKTKAAKRRQYDSLTNWFILPKKHSKSNSHQANKGGFIMDFSFDSIPSNIPLKPLTPVVSGLLSHNEHKNVRLSTTDDIKFYACFENLAKNSYSATGNVD